MCWLCCGGCGGFAGVGARCAVDRCPRGPTRIHGEPGVLGEFVALFVVVLWPLAFGRVVSAGGWKGAGVGVGVVCVNADVIVRRGVVGTCTSGCCMSGRLGIDQRLGWGVGVVFGV